MTIVVITKIDTEVIVNLCSHSVDLVLIDRKLKDEWKKNEEFQQGVYVHLKTNGRIEFVSNGYPIKF